VKEKEIRQLTSEKNWETLTTAARQYRNKPTTKRMGNTDTWSVQLKEVGEVTEERGGAKVCPFPPIFDGADNQHKKRRLHISKSHLAREY